MPTDRSLISIHSMQRRHPPQFQRHTSRRPHHRRPNHAGPTSRVSHMRSFQTCLNRHPTRRQRRQRQSNNTSQRRQHRHHHVIPIMRRRRRRHLTRRIRHRLRRGMSNRVLTRLLSTRHTHVLTRRRPYAPRPTHRTSIPIALLTPHIHTRSNDLEHRLPNAPPTNRRMCTRQRPQGPRRRPRRSRQQCRRRRRAICNRLPRLNTQGTSQNSQQRSRQNSRHIIRSSRQRIAKRIRTINNRPRRSTRHSRVIMNSSNNNIPTLRYRHNLVTTLSYKIRQTCLVSLRSRTIPSIVRHNRLS